MKTLEKKLSETDLFFEGIDRGELGVVDLLIEVFKIRSKIWWLQKDKQTIENQTVWSTDGR